MLKNQNKKEIVSKAVNVASGMVNPTGAIMSKIPSMVSTAKKYISGAGEAASNFAGAAKANKESKKNIIDLAIKKNLKKYNTTPSNVKDDLESGIMGSTTKAYMGSKKKDIKESNKKYGF